MKLTKILIYMLIVALLFSGCGTSGQNTPDGSKTPTSVQTTQSPKSSASGTPEHTPAQTVSELTPGVKPQLSISFINVGRAESILIQADEKSYLIDTGTQESVPSMFRGLALSGVTKLDGLFLTHTHSDHIGGAEALVKKCTIDTLYSSKFSMNDKDGTNRIDEFANEFSLNHKKLSAGDRIEIGGNDYFKVLAPLSYASDDDNNNSLVMMLYAGGIKVLLTGDMQFPEEDTLFASKKDIKANVLKVANHGNPDATSDKLVKAVGAGIAVISTDSSVDDNTPADRVIGALGKAQIYVTQEYQAGILLTASDGNINVTEMPLRDINAEIEIRALDRDSQTVTLFNNGGDIDISGYFLFSTKGNEVFVFPEGSVLKAGKGLTVASKGGSGNFVWNEKKKIWKKDDSAVLYDAFGNQLSMLY